MCGSKTDHIRLRYASPESDIQVEVMTEKLAAGAAFPNMKLTRVDGETFTLPDDIATAYQVVLFYRGHW